MPDPSFKENALSRKAFRKNWARLIQKVYHSDPLICPKCKGETKIIAFIEEEAIIQKILKHLNLWVPGNHDPPLLSNAVVPDMPAANDARSSDNHETLPQMPFEDEYSQLSPYEDHTF
jgi:hypothetical protein